MRLKTRVTLAVTAVTAVALAASFVTVSFLVARDETRDLDHALLLQARAMAQIAALHHAEKSIVSEGSTEVPESWGSITRYMATYEPSGALIAASKSFGGSPPTSAQLSASWPPEDGASTNLSSGKVNLRGVLIPLGERGPVLLYAVSRRTVDEDLQFISRAVSGIFVAAMVLTSLVARWLSARLSIDVLSIAGVARAVAQGDLHARVGSGARGSAETQMLASDMDHMIGQLGSLVTAQRTFIAHAAHELRSPLATIRGELQLALRRPRDAAGYRRTIEEVLGDVDSLAVLSEDLLVLARVQAGAAAPGQTPPSALVRDVVSDALRMARGDADERGVGLDVDPEHRSSWEDLSVSGARGEVARALRNLVDNAVAHSPAGGRVAIHVEPRGSRLAIAVSDDGPGVAAPDKEQIFEPFYRGSKDQDGERAGAGLGLTIARGIARAHGGDVTLDAPEGRGARFVLELPIALEAPKSAPPAQGS